MKYQNRRGGRLVLQAIDVSTDVLMLVLMCVVCTEDIYDLVQFLYVCSCETTFQFYMWCFCATIVDMTKFA